MTEKHITVRHLGYFVYHLFHARNLHAVHFIVRNESQKRASLFVARPIRIFYKDMVNVIITLRKPFAVQFYTLIKFA